MKAEVFHPTIIFLRVLRVLRGFLVAYGKKSLEEILFKMLLRKKYFREIAILNRFLDRLGP